jgi:predicted transglutaminase-like cysteine proteinase
MSPERWNLVYQVNSYVNGKISAGQRCRALRRARILGLPDGCGRLRRLCAAEEALSGRPRLSALGLLITVVLDEKNEGHAVLTVTTDEGDFILDNRRNEIRRWSDLDYVWLKRQSERDPREWVSLARGLTTSAMLTPAEASAVKN